MRKEWKRIKVTELPGFFTTYPGTAILQKNLDVAQGEGRIVIYWTDLLPKADAELDQLHGRPGFYRITVEACIPYEAPTRRRNRAKKTIPHNREDEEMRSRFHEEKS